VQPVTTLADSEVGSQMSTVQAKPSEQSELLVMYKHSSELRLHTSIVQAMLSLQMVMLRTQPSLSANEVVLLGSQMNWRQTF
jgi:hypothetical protein